MDTGHPVREVRPVVARVPAKLPFPVRFRGPSCCSPSSRRQTSEESHSVLPSIGVVKGCVKKPIPDPGGPNVRAHSWHIGLWPRQLPTARSGKEEKQTFRNIAQLLLWTLFLMSHLFCSHYFRSLHTIQNSRFSWDSNWDRQSRPLDHHHHHGP